MLRAWSVLHGPASWQAHNRGRRPSPCHSRPPPPSCNTHTPTHEPKYVDERDLPIVMGLIDRDLSEPYSIFTYRYFLAQWPHLCILATAPGGAPAGVIVCKLDAHRDKPHLRGYLAMLVVDKAHRGAGIGAWCCFGGRGCCVACAAK